jgi:hypothetical protein
MKLSLPEEKRVILASAGVDSAVLYCPVGPLTREELDLIDLPAGTHVLDRLIPPAGQRAGDCWKLDPRVVRLLLGLDAVSESDVEAVFVGLERGYAKLRLAGVLAGTTDGAATKVEVKAGYLIDTRLRRVTRLNLAFSEKREEGRIGPAVDVVGKLTLEISPAGPAQLPPDELRSLTSEATPAQTLLEVRDEPTGLRLLHNRAWFVTSHERERLILRRIDEGGFLAQCNVIIRPEHQQGRQPTMADFEREVRYSLGERFEALVTAGEWTNAAGLRCYRLLIHGRVDDLPMEWRYYLASPPSGRSVALVFSVEPHLADRLGEDDTAIVESVQLPPAPTQPSEPETAAQTPVSQSLQR